jgi:hypothetical protein
MALLFSFMVFGVLFLYKTRGASDTAPDTPRHFSAAAFTVPQIIFTARTALASKTIVPLFSRDIIRHRTAARKRKTPAQQSHTGVSLSG